MRKFHPFFSIGTVGMIVIACLHLFLALGLSLISIYSISIILDFFDIRSYPHVKKTKDFCVIKLSI